jgi:hypothetical protein
MGTCVRLLQALFFFPKSSENVLSSCHLFFLFEKIRQQAILVVIPQGSPCFQCFGLHHIFAKRGNNIRADEELLTIKMF